MPRVTVIVPTYNRANLLPHAVDSVLAQSFTDFELLVVDDGSTDNTREVVDRYEDSRVRYVRRERGGISAAVNTGIWAASGELIARLDSDDVWLPELLEVQAAALDGAPSAGFVYAKGTPINLAGEPIEGQIVGRKPKFGDDAFASLLLADCTCNITIVARLQALKEAGLFDETLRMHEDWDMWLRVARNHPMLFSDRVLANFRWHDGNTTAPHGPLFEQLTETRGRVLDKQFSDPSLPSRYAALKSRAYSSMHLEMGVRLWTNGLHRQGLRRYRMSVASADRKWAAILRAVWFGMLRGPLRSKAPSRFLVDHGGRILRRLTRR